MPDTFIGFASDCMGNLFGFQRLAPSAVPPSDSVVYVFDHDFMEVSPVAPSFVSFLAAYIAIPEEPAR
jgi:hypothetical protein